MQALVTNDGASVVLSDEPAIGFGGESRVYAGHLACGRRVAVKVALWPLPFGAWLDEERALLERLGAVTGLAERVVGVRGHGVWGDRPFLVLDWCPRTLAGAIASSEDVRARLVLARRTCEAVSALHAAVPPVLHRDIKPTNVLIDDTGRVRLTDFGAARPLSADRTVTTTTLFTPGFSPPEQCLAVAAPSLADDVYGLAATVFYAVVGRAPAAPAHNMTCLTEDGAQVRLGRLAPDRESAPARWFVLERMVALAPEDVRELESRVTGPLVEALRRALEPRPGADRGTASELAAAVAATRVHEPRTLRPWVPGALAAVALVALVASGVRAPGGRSYEGVRVPGGAFPMGFSADDPERQLDDPQLQEVTVAPFLAGRTEVSQALWQELTGITPLERRQFVGGTSDRICSDYLGVSIVGDHLPMVCLSWLDAVAFANALSDRDGLAPAYQIGPADPDGVPAVAWDRGSVGWRLPTEVEWEYLARGGRDGAWDASWRASWCGVENVADVMYRARFPDQRGASVPCRDGWVGPAPVGSRPPNALGVADVVGNVSEWTWDATTPYVRDSPYPPDSPDRPWRSMRGTNWTSSLTPFRTPQRGGAAIDFRGVTSGVRLVRSAS